MLEFSYQRFENPIVRGALRMRETKVFLLTPEDFPAIFEFLVVNIPEDINFVTTIEQDNDIPIVTFRFESKTSGEDEAFEKIIDMFIIPDHKQHGFDFSFEYVIDDKDGIFATSSYDIRYLHDLFEQFFGFEWDYFVTSNGNVLVYPSNL